VLALPSHPLPPPPWALRFRSDDLDEVRAFVGTDMPHSRVAHRSEALGYDFYRVLAARAAVGSCKVAAAQTVRGRVSDPVLHLTVPAGSVYRVGRRVSAPTGRSSVVFVAPEWEFTRTSPAGTLLAIKVDQRALLDELETRRPSAGGGWALRLEWLALAPAERAEFMAAAADLQRATRPGTEARHLAHAESRLVALVADLILRESVAPAAGALSLARALDLEGWIEAHLGEPLTLGRLCQVAGVGARCLQKTFESRRGVSPMRFVTERRLTAAHRRLIHAAPNTSVTRIALDLGFDHLGRFSQMYKQVIGESPSQTLAAP
jgi:AraC-like DNA-binding protein